MNIQELQKKHLTVYNKIRKTGIRYKILLLLMMIPAISYTFFEINRKYHRYYKEVPYSHIVAIIIGIAILSILIILFTKSISLIDTQKVKSLKYYFKNDFFECIVNEIPEIDKYINNHMIQPEIFEKSCLFKSTYSDYEGDDWMQGHLKNASFELCELDVFKLYRSVFNGLFIRIITMNQAEINTKNLVLDSEFIRLFERKHKARIFMSRSQNEIYLAIKKKGRFFESDNSQMIKMLDDNILFLKDTVELMKLICYTY